MSNLIGQSLGRYHILEKLGEGGMAVVYKAYDTRLEAEVAVKVIRTENILPSALERTLKRFEREAKALARLTHPNIVKVIDYGEYEGKPYLVMPLLSGGTLKSKLSGKPMPSQDAVRLLIPIADALGYAHKHDIIHRDVKPANILITEDGQPMLADFGVAKMLDVEETMELTGTGVGIGTPEYMAPEQVTNKLVDERADIYALGIVLFEMVTGRKPYIADTPMAVLIMHSRDPLPRPKSFVPNLPQAVENILFKALAKNPKDRYQTMAEFAKAMEEISSGKKFNLPMPVYSRRAIIIVGLIALGIGLLAIFFKPLLALPAQAFATSTPTFTSTPSNTPVPSKTSTLIATASYTLEQEQSRAFAAPILDAIANRIPDYVDDFENPASGWQTGNAVHPTGGKGEIGYKNGQYSMALSEGQCLDTNVPRQRVFSDLVFETQVLFIANDSVSAMSNIDFRWWETANGHGSYHVSWRTDGFFILEKETWAGNVQSVQELGRGMNLALPASREPIHVLLIAVGPQFVLYVNDKPYLAATDPQFSDQDKTGYLKFGLCSINLLPIEARWDYLNIWDISNLNVP